MNVKTFSTLLVITVSLSLFLSGCDNANNSPKGKSAPVEAPPVAKSNGPVRVEVGKVEGIAYSEKIDLPGSSVHGMETSQLFSRVGGYVQEVKSIGKKEIDIGSLVKKGMPLAVIAIPELRDELSEKLAKVEQAKSAEGQAIAAITQSKALTRQRMSEVTQAKSHKSEKQALLDLQKTKYQRIQALVKTGSIGTENRDEAEYAVKAAQSALESVAADEKAAEANVAAAQAGEIKAVADKASATANLAVAKAVAKRAATMVEFATIRAPYDGIITKRHVDHGAFVRPATSNSGAMPLFEVSRIDKVRVVASVPNTHASRVREGQKIVFFNIGGLPGVAIEGTISRSSSTLDKKSRMMRVDIEFKNPVQTSKQKLQLKPGMYGTVSVRVNDWKNLPIVPVSAVQFDNLNQPYLMVINGTTCQKKPVSIVFNNAKSVGIASDIKVGDSIVLNPAGKLKDGQEIVSITE
ncbi:MAG: efflux RND transporter periplasmic adaptor subunit [Planctomycetes bacterium]|nr:efflux RND transporter periplasmic adaptor subunit [Planctomycetota bacterium]MCH9723933.1 efflux RND transporter periplasmic adaptor subunit [Planctomycetota bacterium]MCH9778659.1 efflux RND transporter periplasmic adaptor subunit [Planctomycetota bacterium]MCH9789379.1 efflux RND transporter periplasmic adaptor subunit [Planctomycetota bacterium]